MIKDILYQLYEVRFVIFLIVLFLTIMLLTIISIFYLRNKRERIEKRNAKLTGELHYILLKAIGGDLKDYQELLKSYTKSTIPKRLLQKSFLTLYTQLIGDESEVLREWYLKQNLHVLSLNDLKCEDWSIVAQGIQDICTMKIVVYLPNIEKFLKSNNRVLKNIAQKTFLQLTEPNIGLSFLNEDNCTISKYQAIELYEILKTKPIDQLPNFTVWFTNKQDSVVMFAVKMSSLFNKTESIIEMKPLLFHPNDEIKLCVIEAMSSLSSFACKREVLRLLNYPNDDIEIAVLRYYKKCANLQDASIIFDYIKKRKSKKIDLNLILALEIIAKVIDNKVIYDRLISEHIPYLKRKTKEVA